MTQLVHDRRGEGPPLVLVHGIGSRWQVFEPVLDQVAAHREVFSLDLPGFGSSLPDPGIRPSVPGYAARVADFITEQGLDLPEVGGSSMGAGIALELGRLGAVSKVTAFAPVGFWTPAERRWCVASLSTARALLGSLGAPARQAMRTRVGRIALLGLVLGHPSRADPDVSVADLDALVAAPAFRAAAEAFSEYDVRDPGRDWGHLHELPTTVAWGSRDAVLVHATQSARAARALPWATHVTLPGCGHLPFSDDPARCAELLLR